MKNILFFFLLLIFPSFGSIHVNGQIYLNQMEGIREGILYTDRLAINEKHNFANLSGKSRGNNADPMYYDNTFRGDAAYHVLGEYIYREDNPQDDGVARSFLMLIDFDAEEVPDQE